MDIRRLGSQYGGWVVDLDSINHGDCIIGGGVGEDISFEVELLKLINVKPVLVDPTKKSHEYIEKNHKHLNLEFVKKAIYKDGGKEIRMYLNKNPEHVSESISNSHGSTSKDFYLTKTITIPELVTKYKPSLIKIDIEGAEYEVLRDCVGVKQICVEFHHWIMDDKDLKDTLNLVSFMELSGYDVISNMNNYQEVTFLRR